MKMKLFCRWATVCAVAMVFGGGAARADVIADSQADWSGDGTQGENGWSYGYYDYTADVDDTYTAAEFIPFTNDSLNQGDIVEPYGDFINHWNGTQWDMANANSIDGPAANVPWTSISAVNLHPNGTNSGPAPGVEHWAIRRWVADELTEVTPLAVTWHTRKGNGNGNGVTGGIAVNGAIVDEVALAGNDTTGVTRTYYVNANVGDIVDLFNTPVGLDGGRSDGSDGSANWMTVDTTIPVPAFQPDGSLFVSATATDTDGDTIDDGWEEVFGTKADFSLGGDFDNDGLTDEKEFAHGSDPTKADSDDDGVPDVIEEGFGSKSNSAESDGDGISDFDEVNGDPATNPGKADSDDDGSNDPEELAWGSDPNDAGDTPFTFVVADSIGDWSTTGTQGENGWTYGFYDLTDDEFVDGVYQTDDFQAFANTGGQVEPDGNHWAGANWDMANGTSAVPNVPWTFVAQEQGHPNGTNNGVEHWAIRRWVADELTEPTSVGLIWNVRAQNTNGDGTTGVLMVNGNVVDEVTVAGNDAVGEVRRVFANLNPGDIVDLALTPEGLTNRIDGSDGSFFWYRVDTRMPALPQQPDGRYFIPIGSADSDGDNLADFWEEIFFPGDLGQLTGTGDFDEDGLSDLGEMLRGGFPNVKDTDGDGLEDGRETGTGVVGVGGDTGTDLFIADTDGDGKHDGDEVDGPTPTDPHDPDSDFDGLTDGQETNTGVYVSIDDVGSDPNNIDSDGDSLLDGDEIFGNPDSDPNQADSDGDLLTDVEELGGSTDPWLFDSDGDGWGDGEELTANTFPADTPDFGLEKPASNEIANSEFDFTPDDIQGDDNGWLYGYRNVTVDGKGLNYDPEDDFIAFGPEHWNGRWDLGGGAPWTEVSSTGGHPNGTNNGDEHWPMYRWVAGVDAPTPVLLTWNLRKANTNGGNGTSVGLYLNGTFLSGGAVGGTDGVGRYGSHYVLLNPGDIVDLTLKPAGPNGIPADGADGSLFGLIVDTELSSDPRQPDGSKFVIGDPAPLTVASVEFDAILRSATIVWNSIPSKKYEVWVSDDLANWIQLADELDSGGSTTSYTEEAIPGNLEVRYYQIREAGP